MTERAIYEEHAINLIVNEGKKQFPEFTYESTSGIPGEFYTKNREIDIKWLCHQIIGERSVHEGEKSICQ